MILFLHGEGDLLCLYIHFSDFLQVIFKQIIFQFKIFDSIQLEIELTNFCTARFAKVHSFVGQSTC